jgi:hypothetical protein
MSIDNLGLQLRDPHAGPRALMRWDGVPLTELRLGRRRAASGRQVQLVGDLEVCVGPSR